MGEVWLAQQCHPIPQQVALKVIKVGIDTRQVIARFEAERQAMALMDHPTIATVFDGGATPQGRPCFAMECVKGEPITPSFGAGRVSVSNASSLHSNGSIASASHSDSIWMERANGVDSRGLLS